MNIRDLRKKRNWTQYDLEFESGVSQAVISRIERGAKPTDKQRELIINALK